jgi:hypothetical protein
MRDNADVLLVGSRPSDDAGQAMGAGGALLGNDVPGVRDGAGAAKLRARQRGDPHPCRNPVDPG